MKKYIWILLSLVVLSATITITNNLYYEEEYRKADLEGFESKIHEKEGYARAKLNEIKNNVQKKGLWTITRTEDVYKISEEKGMSFFVIEGDNFKYWSSNRIDVRTAGQIPYDETFYMKTYNYHSIGVQCADNKYRYVALIRIKRCDFPGRQNDNNKFEKDLEMPSSTYITEQSEPNSIEIMSQNGTYLFSLKGLYNDSPNAWLVRIEVAGWLMIFGIILLLLHTVFRDVEKKKAKKWQAVLLSAVVTASLVGLACNNWPDVIFQSKLFSPIHYATEYAPSLGHLALYTIAIINMLLYWMKVMNPTHEFKERSEFVKTTTLIMSNMASAILFTSFYLLTLNLIHNSTMDVSVAYIQDISIVTISALALITIWLIFVVYTNLHLTIHSQKGCTLRKILIVRFATIVICAVAMLAMIDDTDWVTFTFCVVILLSTDLYIYYVNRANGWYTIIMAALCINLTVAVCYIHCNQRNMDRYQTLASNLTDAQATNQSPQTELLMPETSYYIMNDNKLKEMLKDSVHNMKEIEKYVVDKHFGGKWERFEVNIQVVDKKGQIDIRKSSFGENVKMSASKLEEDCVQVPRSMFLLSTRSDLPLSYLGKFEIEGKTLYAKLYPNINNSQMAFYEQKSKFGNIGEQMEVSTAKYYDNEQIYMSGDYHYPNVSSWIPNDKRNEFHFYSGEYVHFVSRYCEGKGITVVSKMTHHSYNYILFMSYMAAIFTLMALLYMVSDSLVRWRKRKRKSIMSRMMVSFLIPLLCSFGIIGAISVTYFMNQFKKQEIGDLSNRANSIQQRLQSSINMQRSFEEIDMDEFASQMKEMAILFQVDISAYNKSGALVASSRSSLNNKNKQGRLMVPQPLFNMNSEHFRIDSYDNLDLYSFCTRLYNRKNQFVGYLDVRTPQGAEMVKNEVFSLLVVLIDIYLVIMLLTVFAIWYMSHKLTKPISMLALKFKETKLLGTNTKIEYKDEDEIGILVDQYNLMVDQLHESADQLAKSQRELAWRDMARRIAHEIKNPLTPMKLSVQMSMRKKELDPEGFDEYYRKMSNTLIEQIDNLSRIATSFSTFAKTTITTSEDVDIASKTISSVSLFENNHEGVKFSLNMNGIESAIVKSDNQQILQVFNNLFKNAIQAIPEDREGHVDVDFDIVDKNVVIKIKDNGCGIPEENRDTIFQPNFTTKTSGMGLGLSIVKTIINLSNGDISMDSEVGVGTTFTITIPLTENQ